MVTKVLQSLTVRLNELLVLWPENPVLEQLLIIATRILNFSVSSPLVKVLVGLQILIDKAYEW